MIRFFARVELSCRDLGQRPCKWVTVLGHEQELPILRHGGDRYGTRVADDLTDGAVSVRQFHGVPHQMYDPAQEDLLMPALLFP